MEDDDSAVVVIDPKGDVVLGLNCSDVKKKLLVSSKILSMVSPVFAAMFSSRFKEGLHSVTPGSSLEIPLPEDDAIAFETICNVVHYRHKHIPTEPSLEELMNIAIIADKYELCETLCGYSVIWLHSGIKKYTGKSYNATNCCKLLSAAYILDTPDEFARISWDIVLNHVGPYINLPGITDHAIITHDMMAEFDARTANIRADLVNALCRSLGASVNCNKENCSGILYIVSEYIKELRRSQLWPLSDMYQDESLITTYQKLLDVEPKRKQCAGSYCRVCTGPMFTFAGYLRDWKETVFTPQFGICLDCVKTGRESLRKKECRIRHP